MFENIMATGYEVSGFIRFLLLVCILTIFLYKRRTEDDKKQKKLSLYLSSLWAIALTISSLSFIIEIPSVLDNQYSAGQLVFSIFIHLVLFLGALYIYGEAKTKKRELLIIDE